MLALTALTLPCALIARPAISSPMARRAAPTTMSATPSGADGLILSAMEKLKGGEVDGAVATLAEAREECERSRSAPIGSERATLLALVQARVDAAVATRNLAESKTRQQSGSMEAMRRGDKAIADTVGAIAIGEIARAHELLALARSSFAEAGGTAERDREGVLGNLYASLRAEEERQERVKKLLRQKELVEQARAKKKKRDLGLGGDDDDDDPVVKFSLR